MAVQLSLLDESLWSEFHAMRNEMIITKNGRCMFPLLRLRVAGVSSGDKLAWAMGIVRMDRMKWKYKSGAWHASARERVGSGSRTTPYDNAESPEVLVPTMQLYEPAESPSADHTEITFAKTKLTNQASSDQRQEHCFALQSFCRYQPVVVVANLTGLGMEWASRVRDLPLASGAFWWSPSVQLVRLPSTQFIAVTHYQNERVTDLKKAFNPHAKGFLSTVTGPLISLYYSDDDTNLAESEYIASRALEKLSQSSSGTATPPVGIGSPPRSYSSPRRTPKKRSSIRLWSWH